MKTYAYYVCQKSGCPSAGKSIKRDQIEGDFEQLLKSVQLTPQLLGIAERMLGKIWTKRSAHEDARTAALKRKLTETENEIDKLLDRVVVASTASVIAAFESRIERLEGEKSVLMERITESGQSTSDYQDVARTALSFLKNPWNLWISDRLVDRQTVLKLTFQGN